MRNFFFVIRLQGVLGLVVLIHDLGDWTMFGFTLEPTP